MVIKIKNVAGVSTEAFKDQFYFLDEMKWTGAIIADEKLAEVCRGAKLPEEKTVDFPARKFHIFLLKPISTQIESVSLRENKFDALT